MKNISFSLYILFILIICSNNSLKCQDKKTIILTGYVNDAFTELGIPKTKVYLMTEDSVVIASQTVREIKSNNYAITTFVTFQIPRKAQKLIAKAEHPGYNTTYVNYYLKPKGREAYYDMPPISMLKKKRSIEGKLGEVVVQASKVKMVYKGDTLIFNADAFNIPEGSMLGNLIRQMPGTEIDPNGVITVNGRRVDYLTLNGKKLFNGDNKVLMDNLPYYIVKDLKVFEQSKEEDLAVGRTTGGKEYIMDVVLKPEYNVKSFGNADAGIGTENRYLGHAFGAFNSNNVNGLAYGNINNVNETELPGNNGWTLGFNPPRSIQKNKQLGVSGTIEKKKMTDNFSLKGGWTDQNTETQQTHQTYLSGNNAVKKLMDWNNQKNENYSFTNELAIKKPVYIGLDTYARYAKGRNRVSSQSATFDGMPMNFASVQALFDSIHNLNTAGIKQKLINSTLYNHKNDELSWNVRQAAYTNFSLPWGDDMRINANVTYYHNKVGRDEQQDISYYQSLADATYQYLANENTKSNGYSYDVSAQYNYNLTMGEAFGLSYGYSQKLNTKERERFKNQVNDNSYHQTLLERNNLVAISYFRQEGELRLNASLGMEYSCQDMNDTRNTYNADFYRSYVNWLPALDIRWDLKRRKKLTFTTKLITSRRPAVSDLVAITDDSNPLMLYKGNPELKKEQTFSYSLDYACSNAKHEFTFNVAATGGAYLDRITGSTLYDERKGVYTLCPYNVDGNWFTGLKINAGRALDKKNTLRLQNNLSYTYNRWTDMSGTTDNGLEKSRMNMHVIYEQMRLSYQYRKLRITGTGYISWQHTQNPGHNDRNLDIKEFAYGLSLNYNLPRKLQLAGDLMMYSHRGYQWQTMNTDDFIGNFSLSRFFLKDKLHCKLIAYDIFHQCTSHSYTSSAQGWSETYYNCIPRYMMVVFSYRFGSFKK